MARGRFINNKITFDKRVNDLSDDTSRLAFTWLITFADVEGRTYGDPALVRSMLFPRRDDISVEQMEAYIQEWHNAGLIKWYEAQNDLFIAFPKFDDNQPNLRKDREAESTIPEPPKAPEGEAPEQPEDDKKEAKGATPELIPSDTGEDQEQGRVKLKDLKLKDKKEGAAAAVDIPTLIANATGMVAIPPDEMERTEQVRCLVDAYGQDEVMVALSNAFKLWIGQKRKDGKGNYKRTNFGWVDWAQEKLSGGQVVTESAQARPTEDW